MCDRQTHEKRTSHNEAFLEYLLGCPVELRQLAEQVAVQGQNNIGSALESRARAADGLCDWQLTGLFYAAVHVVDAFLAAHANQHPRLHTIRGQLIQRHISHVWVEYRQLKNLSETARYEPVVPISLSHVATALECYAALKQEVTARMP